MKQRHIRQPARDMAPTSLSYTAINGASNPSFLGSQEHRTQVSRFITESLFGTTATYESLTPKETVRQQTRQDNWEKPARAILSEASAAGIIETNSPFLQRSGCTLLPSAQLERTRTPPQYHTPRDNTGITQPLLSLLSPPPSHSHPPRPLPSSQFECGQRTTWTPPLSSPTLPHCLLSPKQELRQKYRFVTPVIPDVPQLREPLHIDAEPNVALENLQGGEMDEMIAVIDEEIALYEIREKYEEAVGGHCWHGIMGWCGGGGGRG
ncbi:hypothetical protein COCSADRAFT_357307 [Bipolaris sorokiniana ND90Pr]|uniref:Uncharacterized protein n=1 Tax=Cochliobolus sativus (strain ND90Pr / ATCC 201652) TaxID=665912 RepID=M2T513_COCSN|nr:uncharacterized protein COCSADRAFT_357307 [Bipolaris sorokiniana ND90Pr]EMD64346.1 hypothetical protein COCSADRAFT_357307 [Bipolaris sorokiniana ND90Pr]